MKSPISNWEDCWKFWPYFDHEGRFRIPFKTQRREVVIEGDVKIEYREREETKDEYELRQW